MKTLLTPERLWSLLRPGQIALSPDGRRVLCTVAEPSLAADRNPSALWSLPTQGRVAPRRLTWADGSVSQPSWSPQGDRIAFLARRAGDGQPQLYLMDAAGGEARRTAEVPMGIEAYAWLPHGRGLLFSAWVWPGLRGWAAQQRRWKQEQASKATGRVTEEAQHRHWDRVLPPGRVRHLLQLDLASGRITDLFEGGPWELPREDATPAPFDPCPDGRHVVFVADPAAEKRTGNRCLLARLDLRTRKVRRLVDDAGWHFETPRVSPDGMQMAVLAAEVGVAHTMPLRPALVPLDRPRRWQPLGRRWDHEAGTPRWAADGGSLLLTAEDRGRCRLWRCTPDGDDGRFEALTDHGWVQGFDVRGDALVTLADGHSHPARVHLHRPGQAPRRLERFNDAALAGLSLGEVREQWITGAEGHAVQAWVTLPPGFDARRRHPVLQVIHGGPHAAAGDTWSWRWNAHALAAQGHVVVQVNYHGSSGFGHAFRHAIMGRLGALELQDLEAATDWLRRQRWVDPRRIHAAGGSYGGFMVAWLNARTEPGRYRSLVCHAGVFDRVATFAADSWPTRALDLGAWYWDDLARVHAQSPHAHARGMRTPTLVSHGALDYRVPDCNGLALYNTLKARGVDARLLWYPDENHWVLRPSNSLQWYGEVLAWLARHDRADTLRPR